MTEIKATAMATSIAKALGINREAAFDAILATAQELSVTGTRYSEKLAAEIEAIVCRDAKQGKLATIARQAIGA